MDLGPHAQFVWAAYGAAIVVLAALLTWLGWQGARYQKQLADLEARGVRRRSVSEA